ncbi:hypothetical protein, partial [Ancylomarina longa]
MTKGISQAPTLYDDRYMGYDYKMIFTRAFDEVEAREDFNRSRTDKMQLSFDYNQLNNSYGTRQITLSDDYFNSYS